MSWAQMGHFSPELREERRKGFAEEKLNRELKKRVVAFKDDTWVSYDCGCGESRLEAPEYYENRCAKHSKLSWQK